MTKKTAEAYVQKIAAMNTHYRAMVERRRPAFGRGYAVVVFAGRREVGYAAQATEAAHILSQIKRTARPTTGESSL